jgi:glycosyltransferase involved in cell wall biosynthesis
MKHVDIGLFAHNEQANIVRTLTGLLKQDVGDLDVRLVVLANGCRDATVEVVRSFIKSEVVKNEGIRIEVEDLEKGGKSRTWNRFVHSISRPDADVLIFSDADIELPQSDAIRNLVQGLRSDPMLYAFNSHPIKDIVHRPGNLSFLDKLIARGSETLNDWKTAICGSLYAMPAQKARGFHMPIGLAVEDGFLRAMILTDNMTTNEDLRRITGGDVFHVFSSERTISALVKHQTRIVIGSAVNAAIFNQLVSLPPTQRQRALIDATHDDGWLTGIIRAQLPRWPYAWIPSIYLTKRVRYMLQQPQTLLQPKKLLLLVVGFCFDVVVYVNAQIKMARGAGSGYW